jgi:aryl-alcohol dehydrogenase-like predicted oxidoreductase
MTFGEKRDWGTQQNEAQAILAAFAEAGGVFIDTAPNYAAGAAEEIVGQFVSRRRDDFVVATKYTASTRQHILAGGNSRRSMIQSVERSLRRMNTDYIDLLWLHYWDATTPIDEILRAFDDLTRAGKILHAGFSDTPAWLVSRAATTAEIRGWTQPIAIQVEYNLTTRAAERELLPMADALELGTLCWGPLGAGALAGGDTPQRRKRDALPAALLASAERATSLAADQGTDLLTLALHWLLANPRHRGLIPIIGARTLPQMRQLLDSAEMARTLRWIEGLDAVAGYDPGFPHEMIASPYLRKLATGGAAIVDPVRPRS